VTTSDDARAPRASAIRAQFRSRPRPTERPASSIRCALGPYPQRAPPRPARAQFGSRDRRQVDCPWHAEKGPPRGQFASQPEGGVMFCVRKLRREPPWESLELAPPRAIRGQFASRRGGRRPLARALLPRPSSPNARGLPGSRRPLGAQVEAQAGVRARCCRSHDAHNANLSRLDLERCGLSPYSPIYFPHEP